MIENAMILAAGLGTRMRPLTKDIPKPLVKVHQKSLIDYKLDAARKSGIKNIVVNVHYLADQMEEHLNDIDGIDITISDERDLLLDSGGGILNALNHFDNKPFLVMNSDTFWIDDTPDSLLQLFDKWDSATMDILLALANKNQAVGFHGSGDFFMKNDGCLSWRGKNKAAPYAFAGDYILHPRIFHDMQEGPFSSLMLFDRAMTKDRLHGVNLEGTWLDVGTPDSLIKAEQAIALLNT
ncbi:MAG: nucleotidyltransferase family protein [Hyphomicrobiales bacterium]|nr:nucleotidyltransferase family protein [Hyphomicrobiales bacterium]